MVLSSNLSAMKRSGSAASAQIAEAYAEEKAASIDADVDAMYADAISHGTNRSRVSLQQTALQSVKNSLNTRLSKTAQNGRTR